MLQKLITWFFVSCFCFRRYRDWYYQRVRELGGSHGPAASHAYAESHWLGQHMVGRFSRESYIFFELRLLVCVGFQSAISWTPLKVSAYWLHLGRYFDSAPEGVCRSALISVAMVTFGALEALFCSKYMQAFFHSGIMRQPRYSFELVFTFSSSVKQQKRRGAYFYGRIHSIPIFSPLVRFLPPFLMFVW